MGMAGLKPCEKPSGSWPCTPLALKPCILANSHPISKAKVSPESLH